MRSLAMTSLLLAMLGLSAPAAAEQDCHLRRVASLEMTFDDAGVASVPATIDGQQLRLIVDTAGLVSMLSQRTVDALQLRRDRTNGWAIGFGHSLIYNYVTPHAMQLGGLKATDKKFLVMSDTAEEDGTLGPEVLRGYDVEFDFAAGRLYLYEHAPCAGNVVYWTSNYARIPFGIDSAGHIRFHADLDGKPLNVTLDTGAYRSLLSLEEAEDLFGFDDKSPDLKDETKGGSQPVYRYPFKTLSVEGLSVNHPDFMLISNKQSGLRETILGMGVLRQLHIYIAYGEGALYVSAASARPTERDAPLTWAHADSLWSKGDFAGASDDYAQLVAQNGGDPYGVLRLELARLRAGRYDSNILYKDIKPFDRTAWPGPLLTLYAKLTFPGDLPAAVAAGPADQHARRQCEADFYLGEWLLGHDDAAGSRPLLHSAADNCPKDSAEYAMAQAELGRQK